MATISLSTLATAVPEGPAYPSAAWTAREAANYAKVLEAPTEQVRNPAFLLRLGAQSATNTSSLLLRDLRDPSWVLAYTPTLAAAVAATTFFAGQLSQYIANLMISAEEAPALLGSSPRLRGQLIA